ncbi:flagellar export chaperone FliS [SAR92 clade bacterium H921]|jgi:flagellar protein FliS|nr:flagellar export chaperone FliS [SAR92 clade bacterium H921]MDG0972375.1 flagellar export chaperone FliS [Porticoccaceae bacterium]MDG1307839.1 flagellar export chaperone FliS [Porticoccaceae bacterium]
MAVNKKALNAYRSVGVASAVPYADRVQLVQMLFDGLLAALADAEGHIQRNDIAGKGEAISRASKIIIGLQGSLDYDKGGELARNLSDLYDYCTRRLLKASLRNDATIIQEVRGLLNEINSAWELLPSLLKSEPVAMAS